MDVGVIGQEALLVRVIEVSAVVDGGLFGRSAAEDLGTPGVARRKISLSALVLLGGTIVSWAR